MKALSSILILSLISFVHAVLLSDAFTSKEIINYLYGQLTQFELSNNTLVGVSTSDQLVGIDVKGDNAVHWQIHIHNLGSSKLSTTKEKVYIYNEESHDIYQVDSKNGALNIVTLSASPVHIADAGQGVFVVDSSGRLAYIDHATGSVSKLELEVVETIRVDSNGRFAYVIVNDSRLLKFGKGRVLFDIEFSVGSIKYFKSGIIITENDQVFKLNERKKKFTRIENDSFKNLQVINENFLYSSLDDSIKIISITKKVELVDTLHIKSASRVELLNSPLNDLIVASSSIGVKDVFDLTDFLITKNPNSIKKFTIKLSHSTSHDFLTVHEDKLALLSIDNELNGGLFSLFDGQLIKPITSHYQYYSNSNSYIIINPPESQQTIHQVHEILEVDNKYILTNWLTRVKRHLAELGKFIVSLAKNGITSNESSEDFGFTKYIVFFDDSHQKLVAIKSTGGIAWESVPIHDEFISLDQLDQDRLIAIFHGFVLVFDSSDGSIIERIRNENYTEIVKVRGTAALRGESTILLNSVSEDSFLVEKGENYISGQFIPHGEVTAKQTWKFRFGETIVNMASIDPDSTTSSVGIPLADKSVLYKYLNPNLVSVLTFDKQLKLYLIDGITGNLLHVSAHPEEEIIDLSSVKIVMDDNWIVYSYFINSPRFEQRINVVDLFDKPPMQTSNSVFDRDLSIDSVKTKSFINPERILDIASSKTIYGITTKSIIAITESGQLIEIPKFVLNSRRIDDRVLTRQDYSNDFSVIPYDPILAQPPAINHKYQLDPTGKILIKPTRFESTSVICYFNKCNQFCSVIQPSKSFDILSGSFAKGKLTITVILLFIVFVITKPFVFNKKLNRQWLDR
ncbi:uncharacterized protein SPAPADRAFT_50624 [Spathaspora passalidarum NRRL Y-27907]|uniref:ER membrane protein complex subunit 1 n=1 Tax=Spathaspora passalidarum (strain NRRL Y-27907 / 11-Y1) TaxID=619300 RepID=G3ANU1_SPAPN|nr:uncharacterized protein SPAPADRAFT_50624 [Spathaspora passalidarum NRRL Y-27907]EGW32026.1 hypothetical protein SPAPADRAFT_50624 [Spathaspora passalidarum NRRL Y-27907]